MSIRYQNKDGSIREYHTWEDWVRGHDERFRATQSEGFEAVAEYVQKQVGPLLRRIEELEAQQKNWKYRGAWDNDTDYQVGNFTTHSGSLWHAKADSRGKRPGINPEQWQLAVKRGGDGRTAA